MHAKSKSYFSCITSLRSNVDDGLAEIGEVVIRADFGLNKSLVCLLTFELRKAPFAAEQNATRKQPPCHMHVQCRACKHAFTCITSMISFALPLKAFHENMHG